jgi:hypothetical protein
MVVVSMAGPENNKESCNLDGAIRQAAQGKDVSAKFNSECSLDERKEFFSNLRERSGAPESKQGTHVSSMLNGFQIDFDSATRKLDGISAPGVQSRHGSAASLEATDSKKHAPVKATESRSVNVADKGTPGVDDQYTQAFRRNLTDDEKKIAKKVGEDLLSGDKVSDTINSLGRDSKVRVMAEVKGHIAEQPGAKVNVSGGDGLDSSRYVSLETAKGQKVLITESSHGIPKDIVTKGNGILDKFSGSKDVYDQPGETKAASSSSGFNLREKLLGKPLIEGDGPLARVARGESITEAERADLEKKKLIYNVGDKTK